MFGITCLLLILAARGGSSKELKPKQQLIEVCSNTARLYPHPNDCRKFLRCINRKQVPMSCPSKTVFDPAMQICVWRLADEICSPEHQEVDVGKQRAHNQTRNIPTLDSLGRAAQRVKSTSFSPKSNLQPVAYMSTAASSKQKTSKAETGLSLNKIQHAMGEYIKPKLGYPATSYGIDMGTIANEPHISYKNINLSSAARATASVKPTTMTTHPAARATASVKPTTMTTHPAVIPEPGNKWYHTMNFITATMSTSALSSGHSQTIRSASKQLHDTHKITENSKENFDRKQITIRKTESNDSFTKQIPAGADPAYDAQERKHLKSVVLDEANQNISNHPLASAIRVRNEHNYGNKTGRIEDNKEGKEELIHGFTSIIVDDVHNSTAEMDNSDMLGVSRNEGRSNSSISEWVGREENSPQQVPGIPSQHNTVRPSVQPSTTSNNETDTAKSAIPHTNYSTEETTKSSQIVHNYVQKKDAASDNARYTDTMSLQVENSSADNMSFDDVGKLIQPYRVRLDRMQNMKTKEKPGHDIDAVPREDDENRISSDETWKRHEVKLLPGMLEHLTAKIVDRDLLVPEARKKWQWYDKTPGTDTTVSNITPTKDNEVNTRTSIVDSSQHLSTENDNLLTPTYVARSKSSGQNGSQPHRARDEGTTDKSVTALPTPAATTPSAKSASSFGAPTTEELTSSGESGVGEQTALPAKGSDETRPAPLLSAPYLATGLARPFRCPEMNGHFPDATNCAVYYRCSRGQAFKRECPPGQVFQSSVKSCVTSSLAPPCPSAYTDAGQEDEAFARSICKEPDGLYRDNVSCAHYFECTNGWPIRRQCMMGTVFDDVVSKCSWSKFVPGCQHQTTPEVEINVSGVGRNVFQCPRDGYFRDPHSCEVYYLCAGNQALRMTCDPGTSFDVTLNMCAWNHLVDDCRSQQGQLATDAQNTVAAMTFPKSSTSAHLELDATESLQQEFQCPEKNGIYPLAEDCGVYYVCADGMARQMSCPTGLGYDVASGVCLERGQLPQCVAPAGQEEPREETTPFSCPEAHGLYSDSSNCSFFVHCFKKVAYRHECQPGTVFSPTNAACTWSQLVPECQRSGQVKPGVSQAYNTGSVAYSSTGRHGVRADTYQQQIIKPATYKVQPVDVQEFICPDVEDGFFRDNVFCDIFHRCVVGKKFTFTCPAGTFFRLDETLCDFSEAVTDCTSDGVRLAALGSQASAVAMSQSEQVQQQVPDQFQLNIVNIDADPIGCPASGGLFPHPRNCRQFVFCSRFVPLVLTCPEPLLFNSQTLTCDFAMKVHCFRSDDYRRK